MRREKAAPHDVIASQQKGDSPDREEDIKTLRTIGQPQCVAFPKTKKSVQTKENGIESKIHQQREIFYKISRRENLMGPKLKLWSDKSVNFFETFAVRAG